MWPRTIGKQRLLALLFIGSLFDERQDVMSLDAPSCCCLSSRNTGKYWVCISTAGQSYFQCVCECVQVSQQMIQLSWNSIMVLEFKHPASSHFKKQARTTWQFCLVLFTILAFIASHGITCEQASKQIVAEQPMSNPV